MTPPIQRAIIIGGGIGGLCAAIGLRQRGVEITVFDRVAVHGELGAGLTLWANAIRGLRALGLADKVIASGAAIQNGAIRDWRGNHLSASRTGEIAALLGEPTIAIHRARLHQILLEALPQDCLRLGETCIGFEQTEAGVTARFASGQTERADLLIGADGIHSAIRKQLFPDVKLRYSGYTAWRAVVKTDDKAALGFTSESWGYGSRFGIVPISDHEIYWFATGNVHEGMKLTALENKHTLLERFRGWHAPIETLIELAPTDSILHNDIYDIAPMPNWSRGRVTLLGDAAHATTPNLGQGACQAIQSSVALVKSLAEEKTLNAALQRYETQRQPQTAWITNESWNIGRVGQWENKLACAVRNLAVRLTPDSALKKRIVKAVGKE